MSKIKENSKTNEIIIVDSPEKLSLLRKSIGQADKKINNSAQIFATTPESGTFSKIGTKEFDIPEVGKRISLGLYGTKADGKEFFVSENAIFASELLNEVIITKSGTNAGSFMLKNRRLSELNKFGDSTDEKLFNLVGKQFTTEKRTDCKVNKSYEVKDLFVKNAVDNAEARQAALEVLNKNTENKDLYAFNIV